MLQLMSPLAVIASVCERLEDRPVVLGAREGEGVDKRMFLTTMWLQYRKRNRSLQGVAIKKAYLYADQ